MAANSPAFECAYCGELRPATDDHVPPKSIYLRPLPANIPTVKACDGCNNGASRDDEYFRDTLLKYHRAGDKPELRPLVDKMLRSLRLPAKQKYAAATYAAMTKVPVQTPAGLYVGTRGAFEIDHDRLTRSLVRYVRGLHRHEFGTSVLDASQVTIVLNPDGINARQREVLEMMRGSDLRMIQDKGFFYRVGSASEMPGESAWLLVFYDVFPVLANVRARSNAGCSSRSLEGRWRGASRLTTL